MLSIDHLNATARSRWPATRAGERADRDPALLIGGQEKIAHFVDQPAFVRVGRAAVVDQGGRPVGVVSVTDIERALRASGLGNSASRTAGLASH